MKDNYLFNKPFPQDKWLDEVARLRGLLKQIEELTVAQEKNHGMTWENNKIAELARGRDVKP